MAQGNVALGVPGVTLEGRLTLRRRVGADGQAQVSIVSSRPVVAARLFAGKTPAAVLELMPLLFSVCAMAHCQAAYLACREACSLDPDPVMDAAQAFLVDVETVREHGLRMLMDWPGFLGEAAQGEGVRHLAHSVPRCRDALFESAHRCGWAGRFRLQREGLHEQMASLEQTLRADVFAMPAQDWLGLTTLADLECWAQSGKTVAARFVAWVFEQGMAAAGVSQVPFLPELDAGAVHVRLEVDPDFVRLPTWEGHPCETTSLARCCDHPLVSEILAKSGKGLLARFAARLVETAQIMVRLRAKIAHGFVFAEEQAPSAQAVQDGAASVRVTGRGLSQVEAARGRLLHRLELEQGVVRDYRIVAPTEWNFHPQGAVAQALGALQVDSGLGLQQQAELLVHAIDPCVGFELSVG